MNDPIWRPTAEQIASANMSAFQRFVRERFPNQPLDDYESLYRWSINFAADFWQSFWDFSGVVASRSAIATVVDFERMPGARWFPGARLNFAENLLRHRDDARALVFWNENGFQRSFTYAELHAQVAGLVNVFREWGVTVGDRVAAFLPNLPESVVAMLAATSLGAVWSSCSPDFGVDGVLDRFGQIAPKILIAADGYQYDGREFDCLPRLREIRGRLPSVEKVVVIPYRNPRSNVSDIADAVMWPSQRSNSPIAFEQLPFDQPLFILYSSGTTGPPKCLIHTAGGILLQLQKEHLLHTDLKRDDRLFYFTTCGWMMWNWLVGSLAVGCEIHLYDGSPLAPKADILFDMAQREGVTVFGTSPRYLTAIAKADIKPKETHDLSKLRVVLSTGSPLSGENFDFVHDHINPDARLSSISGGTDICSCFALGNPITPVYRGELQTRGLGMNVQVFNDAGQSVIGEKGELVCVAPFPSMPKGFWNDPDGAAYRRAYFEHYPGVWHHGDFAEITQHGGMIIYGRSDTILNPGGVRIGTAEIYRQVEQVPEVLESVAVGQDWEGDVRVVLFVKLKPNVSLDSALTKRIKDQIRRNTTPRHVPAIVLAVADIPRTKSGKIVELAVREALHGRPIKNKESLANPESLAFIEVHRASLAAPK